jgi:hypothetical protein
MAEPGKVGNIPVQELKEVQDLTKLVNQTLGQVDSKFKSIADSAESVSKELENSLDKQVNSNKRAQDLSKHYQTVLNFVNKQNLSSKIGLGLSTILLKIKRNITDEDQERIDAIGKQLGMTISVKGATEKLKKELSDSTNYIKASNLALAGAASIFAGLVGVAVKFGASIDKIGETFGSLSVMGKDFQTDLLASSVEATKLGGGIEDVAAITNTLASNFGMSVDEAATLSSKVFDTSKAIGLSGDEAANLFGTLMQTANLSADQAESLAEGAFQLARQKGVAPSAVLKDIAGSAEEIAAFTKDGGDNIADAAVQARQMGLSLSTTAKISEGLLDFESSIANEMEASIMIGKQLNFQKARQLALDGDIAGATKNIVDQVGSEAEFNALNVKQRQSLAKSVGVSVAEMAKLVSGSEKLTLSGAMASSSFGDLLGEEGISRVSSLMNNFKALGATLVNELGPTVETLIGNFTKFIEKGNGLEIIKGVIHGIGGALTLVANNLPTIIGLMVAFKAASLGAAIANSIAGISAVAAATLGVGVPIFLGVLAAGIASAKMAVPKAQVGISGFSGGEIMVGESGPERVSLPRGSNVTGAEHTRQMTQGQNFGKIESALERLVSINLAGNEQRGNQRIIGRRGELAIASEPQRGGLSLGIV